MTNKGTKKLLVGMKEIMDYIEISEPTFYKFIEMGLPAAIISGRWYAHTDNLDKFFQKLTWVSMKDVPEGVE